LIFLGYGIIMEFVQKFYIPYRSFDIGDIIADAIGCSLGVLVSIRMYIKK
jgi:VanZ family protein